MVGAGLSGIAAARALSRGGIPFECFERDERIGGASAWADLRLGASRERLQMHDWPMPRTYPRFPQRTHLVRYLEAYAERFLVDRHIRLSTAVERARALPGGGWEVQLASGERKAFDALVAATGRRSAARAPDPAAAGHFAGEQLHVDEYRGAAALVDRDVVVAGGGPAAYDVAVDVSYTARSTRLAVGRPRYLLPQCLAGRPYDQLPGLRYLLGDGVGAGPLSVQLPWRLRQTALTVLHRLWLSRRLHGLRAPRGLIGPVPATPAPHLVERLLCGRIAVGPSVARLDGDGAVLADGTHVRADAVVWCTGHRTEAPYLPPELRPAGGDRQELFLGVFRPGAPTLAFVGLAEAASGSFTRIAECQSRWVVDYLRGSYGLPSQPAMRAAIEAHRRQGGRRYGRDRRSDLRVDQFDYVWQVRRERRRGRRRPKVEFRG